MGDRRPKKCKPTAPAPRDVFAECGLNAADFVVRDIGGKEFLSGQRFVTMTVKQLPTGRLASGRIGTTKKGADRQRDALLRELLQSFLRS